MISAASSVSAFRSTQPVGSTASTPVAIDCAADVTMYDILKPTPVSVTTPMTMPTVAAAAPTASAYLAPISNATSTARPPIRDSRPSARWTNGTATTIARNTHMPWSPNCRVMSANRSPCATSSARYCAAVVFCRDVKKPTRMHDVMPQNAARYGV